MKFAGIYTIDNGLPIVTAVKLKNAIKKVAGTEYNFSLRNIRVNGVTRGCFGFITNPATGLIVYVNTEEPVLSNLHYMYRYAEHIDDYTGGPNRWASTLPQLAASVVKCLNSYQA